MCSTGTWTSRKPSTLRAWAAATGRRNWSRERSSSGSRPSSSAWATACASGLKRADCTASCEPLQAGRAARIRGERASRWGIETLSAAVLDLRQHGLRAAHFVLPRRFDVQFLHHAVFDQHRVALRAHAHVARGEVELEAELLGPLAAAVAEHAHLAARLLVAAPGGHHEGVVRRHAPDLVHAFRLELAVVLHVARNVLRRAGRRIRPRHREDRDFLAFDRLGDADVLGVDRASRGRIVFGGFGKLAVGKSVADFDGHFGLRSLEFSKAVSIAQLGGKVKMLARSAGAGYIPGHADRRRSGTGSPPHALRGAPRPRG